MRKKNKKSTRSRYNSKAIAVLLYIYDGISQFKLKEALEPENNSKLALTFS